MPAVKSYKHDGSVIRPKVNIEAINDLARIIEEI